MQWWLLSVQQAQAETDFRVSSVLHSENMKSKKTPTLPYVYMCLQLQDDFQTGKRLETCWQSRQTSNSNSQAHLWEKRLQPFEPTKQIPSVQERCICRSFVFYSEWVYSAVTVGVWPVGTVVLCKKVKKKKRKAEPMTEIELVSFLLSWFAIIRIPRSFSIASWSLISLQEVGRLIRSRWGILWFLMAQIILDKVLGSFPTLTSGPPQSKLLNEET